MLNTMMENKNTSFTNISIPFSVKISFIEILLFWYFIKILTKILIKDIF